MEWVCCIVFCIQIAYHAVGESLENRLKDAQEQIASHSERFNDLRNSLSEEDAIVSRDLICLILAHRIGLD